MQVNNIEKKITRFGYIIKKKSLSEQELDCLKKDLTVVPFKLGNYSKFSKNNKFNLYVENGDFIGIPKYYGLEKFGLPNVNKIETFKYPTFDMQYKGLLRPNQEVIVNKIFEDFKKHKGGLLIAGCGSGKTNMAIYIACKYQLKTLFIVHKTFLKRQAVNRILSTTNIKKVGTIQRKVVDIDSPFVVGMVQSLSKIDYDDSIFKDFGMIIIDEVHHMGAKNFSKVFQKMSSKYMLGISAEKNRNDGMFKIINWYMGPILHIEEQKPNDMVLVKKFHYKTSNKKRVRIVTNKYTGEPDRSIMVTNLVHIKCRNRFIINLIKSLFDQGKNILCLSGRLKQVNLFDRLLAKNSYIKNSVGKYIGGMEETELSISATKQIILGTYDMAEEGLDIENLNVVILCTPKSAIKQSVGRILRKDVYEEHPIVIDIVDDDNSKFVTQSQKRNLYYGKQHYNIQHFYFSDYELDNFNLWSDKKEINNAITKIPEKKSMYNSKKESTYNSQNKSGTKYLPMDIEDIEFLDD